MNAKSTATTKSLPKLDFKAIADDFRFLNPNEPGAWPLIPKATVLFVLFVALLVAGWSSRYSVSSRVRACASSSSRVFSMAMTAWSANVSMSWVWHSVNGATEVRTRAMAPIAS